MCSWLNIFVGGQILKQVQDDIDTLRIHFVHPSENPPLGLFGVSENSTFPDTLRVLPLQNDTQSFCRQSAQPTENPLSAKEKSKLGKYAQTTLVFVLFLRGSTSGNTQ